MEQLLIEGLIPLLLFVVGTIIKGPITEIEMADPTDTTWTSLIPFVEEAFEPPNEEPMDMGLGDGTTGQGGVRLKYAIPVIESDTAATKLSEAKTAASDYTKRKVRFTNASGAILTTIGCTIRLEPKPVQAFGSSGVIVVHGEATGAEPGDTYTLS